MEGANKIHTLILDLNWHIVNKLRIIDRFDASWTSIEKREGPSLKHLKSIATVQSIGSSTRIEGSKMTDEEIKVRLENVSITSLEERDEQEVIGYYEALDTISESFEEIRISESSIKNLHHILMKHSKKDDWHKGKYKQQSNSVEETRMDGSKYIIFRTTEPGFATENAMRELIQWYKKDSITHPVVKSAIFVYEFLSIHPFQDGNGRMSRLLTTLLLLKHGYSWIEYISFEHEVENRKMEYYKVLIKCQGKRPGEDVDPWVMFFLDCMGNIQQLLMEKLNTTGLSAQMAPREKMIYNFIDNHPGCQSSTISEKLKIPLPTVKRILAKMVSGNHIEIYGVGAGTNYTTKK